MAKPRARFGSSGSGSTTSIEFGLDGDKELAKAMRKLSASIATRVTREVVKAGGEPVLAAARRRAPVGPTGNLRAGVTSIIRNYSKSSTVLNVIGSTAPHSHLVEFGTGPRQNKKGQSRGQMPANPWLHPAFDESKDKAFAVMRDTAARAIEREGKTLS